MIETLRSDLLKFVMAFSLPFVIFLIIGSYNIKEFTIGLNSWTLFLQLFSSFTADDGFSKFTNF